MLSTGLVENGGCLHRLHFFSHHFFHPLGTLVVNVHVICITDGHFDAWSVASAQPRMLPSVWSAHTMRADVWKQFRKTSLQQCFHKRYTAPIWPGLSILLTYVVECILPRPYNVCWNTQKPSATPLSFDSDPLSVAETLWWSPKNLP